MQELSFEEIDQVAGAFYISDDGAYGASVGVAVGFLATAIAVGIAAPVAAGLIGGLAVASMASSGMAMYYAMR